ncbi:hypothetical protein EJB05_12639, partial [Eragrostis curvula]
MHIVDSKKSPVINKLILCSPNLVAAFVGGTMVNCGHNSQILVCQPGASSWSVRANDECKLFEDMAFYQGKLYALADDENLLIVNISEDPSTGDPQIARIGQVIRGDPLFTDVSTVVKKKRYLVESCGALLMVRRKVCCRMAGKKLVAEQSEFEVFEADLEHSRWVNVTTVGHDQMLFLGRRCSRAVSASQYGMPGDQIFFLDDVIENAFEEYTFEEETTSVSAYNMRTCEIPQCKMTHVEHPRSWSDLPTELVGLVLCRLPAYPDRVRFGAVCRHWSFSSAQNLLPPPLPCLTFPDGTFVSLPHGESFQFHDSAGYHSTCGEWLIFSNDGTYTLKNPFSKVTMTLPNMSCFCLIDEPVEIINGRVIPEGEMTQKSMNMNVKMSLGKVIVCSMLLVAAFVDIGSLSTVALCRPGAASWLVSGLVCRRILFEMMFCEGKLYVIDEIRDLLAIHAGEDNDSGKISISRIERLIENPPFSLSFIDNGVCFTDYFLVECKGALLLVSRTIPGIPCDDSRGRVTYKPTGVDFKVFEANSSLWVGVTCLGDDQALFVGKRYSWSVDVSQYNKLKGNCIFMLDDGSHY